MASTTHCAPNTPASSSSSPGRATAAELTDDLVGARVEHGVGVGDLAHAAADRERDEHLVGRPPRELDHRRALVRGRGDVEEDELVGALGVVGAASSTGSPASRMSMKRVPLTTRPASTSMHGMTRL